MMEPRLLLLVEDPELHDPLERLARELPWAPARGVCFAPLSGDAQQVVAEHRAREGVTPIGVIAKGETNALAALAGGADDATVLTSADAATLTAFVDRVELRAQLRTESQRLHESFAHAEKLTALGTLVAGIGHE